MSDDVLARLRAICLSLPDTKEGVAWRHPVFRVGGRMFCGYEELHGRWTIGVWLEEPHAEALAGDPRVLASQRLGGHTWVSIDAEPIEDWDGIRALILESYRLSAPKKALAKLPETESA